MFVNTLRSPSAGSTSRASFSSNSPRVCCVSLVCLLRVYCVSPASSSFRLQARDELVYLHFNYTQIGAQRFETNTKYLLRLRKAPPAVQPRIMSSFHPRDFVCSHSCTPALPSPAPCLNGIHSITANIQNINAHSYSPPPDTDSFCLYHTPRSLAPCSFTPARTP